MTHEQSALSANEAACVTGVPLKQVHRIVDAGLLGDSVKIRKGARVFPKRALIGLKLAHEMTGILSLECRRRLVRHVLDDPQASTVRDDVVSVDIRSMKNDLKRGIASLAKVNKMIRSDPEIMSGTPCFKGTRVPVHDIADMLTNGDQVDELLVAYPRLTKNQVTSAPIYAAAYPRRRLLRRPPEKWKVMPRTSTKIALDSLLQAL